MMSRDMKDTENQVEIPVNASSPVDKISVEELRQQLLERRAKSGVLEKTGSIDSLGHDRLIPKGFTGMYVKASDVERYFDRGYTYVRDHKDGVCTLTANHDRDASFHNAVLIMAPTEIVEEDQKMGADASKAACNGVGTNYGISQ